MCGLYAGAADAVKVASMEPRPLGRGMLLAHFDPEDKIQKLQWSHDLSVVEWQTVTRTRSLQDRLQWSHDLSVVE